MSLLKFFSWKEKIRTRMAPSPTGYFHIGSARTALFNFLFAKKYGGQFILRIEDTDTERSKKEYEKDITGSMKWLGINWHEGPDIGGSFGPYRQSERFEIYNEYIKKLINGGYAFYCFHTKEFLEREYEEQIKIKKNPAHYCEFRKFPLKDALKRLLKEEGIIRFKTPPDLEIVFSDLIRGEINFNSDTLGGDFSLAKAKNEKEFLPLYNLAVVIDDNLMKISHVIRGEEHISNTPKQILIQQALGLERVEYAHLPLILAPDKSKLSKRHGAMSVNEYMEAGYLPEALINFLALLGWNPGTEKEIFNLEELIKEFDLNKIQKSGAVFNTLKLDWFNGYYIRQMPLNELTQKVIPFLKRDGLISGDFSDWEYIKKIVSLEQPRLKKLNEIGEKGAYFFKSPEYQPELLVWRDMLFKDIVFSLDVSFKTLSLIDENDFNRENLEENLIKESERAKNKDKGRLLWPLRVAITGLEKSPGPFEILEILGKKESLKRIEHAIKKLA
ncbi:MAG: glutamate--tRNA ligase [Patescibacteria group bacterium]